MKVEVPLGEVVDKVTILLIKAERITESRAAANVRHALDALVDAWEAEGLPPMRSLPEWEALSAVNAELWEVEDALRACEAAAEFGEKFVGFARAVYVLNDRRATLKRNIDASLGSLLTEEKSYGS